MTYCSLYLQGQSYIMFEKCPKLSKTYRLSGGECVGKLIMNKINSMKFVISQNVSFRIRRNCLTEKGDEKCCDDVLLNEFSSLEMILETNIDKNEQRTQK
jgi:hypothetical protein